MYIHIVVNAINPSKAKKLRKRKGSADVREYANNKLFLRTENNENTRVITIDTEYIFLKIKVEWNEKKLEGISTTEKCEKRI